MSAEVINVCSCAACGRWRVTRKGVKSLWDGSYGPKVAVCFACLWWGRRPSAQAFVDDHVGFELDPLPPGAA